MCHRTHQNMNGLNKNFFGYYAFYFAYPTRGVAVRTF